MKNFFGIEAAKVSIFRELFKVMSVYGVYASPRNPTFLTDIMTLRGELMPINRHGINRIVDSGVLARVAFEETIPGTSHR